MNPSLDISSVSVFLLLRALDVFFVFCFLFWPVHGTVLPYSYGMSAVNVFNNNCKRKKCSVAYLKAGV